MTGVEQIKQYMEWRNENEGRKVDVSPEAWALKIATEHVMQIAHEIASSADFADNVAVNDLRYALGDYRQAYNNLDGDTNG